MKLLGWSGSSFALGSNSELSSIRDFSFHEILWNGFSLPAGTYEAVRVIIGEGKGQIGGVLFPPLCFVDTKAPEPGKN